MTREGRLAIAQARWTRLFLLSKCQHARREESHGLAHLRSVWGTIGDRASKSIMQERIRLRIMHPSWPRMPRVWWLVAEEAAQE